MNWKSEAEMCSAFIENLPKGWVAYTETCGYDIVLVHEQTGTQIAVEAKLTLNPLVLVQITETESEYSTFRGEPDFKAVLVGKSNNYLPEIAKRLGVKVIVFDAQTKNGGRNIRLPDIRETTYMAKDYEIFVPREGWFDCAPTERLKLPSYRNDGEAGHPSPIVLSEWKIRAIKVSIFVQRNGWIDRGHFKKLKIGTTQWMNGHWLAKGAIRGQWVAGEGFPIEKFRAQHPIAFEQIEADFDIWKPAEIAEQMEFLGAQNA